MTDGLLVAHIFDRVEIFDFACDLDREIRRIKFSDRCYTGFACQKGIPKCIDTDTDGGNYTHASHYYSSSFHKKGTSLINFFQTFFIAC